MKTVDAGSMIRCPKCKASFEMTAAVSEDIRATLEKEYESRAAEEQEKIEKERKELAAQRVSIDKEVARRLETNKKAIEGAARDAAEIEIKTLKEEMDAQDTKLTEARKNEVELRKQQRELEREKNEFQLKLTREIDSQRQKIVEETSAAVADEYAQKQLEWEKQRTDLIKQMEELRRKAEQSSQQAQGEVVELQIESLLKETFTHDTIEEVGKGIKGGDLVQIVQTRTGIRCGSIVWEIKQTKSFSDAWLTKVKEDMRAAKADIAVIVTAAMPKGVERIGSVDGVWVVDYKSFIGLALALRSQLVEVAQARQAQAGRKEKAEEVYSYIVGTEFKSRVQALVETFVKMQDDLASEKRAFDKIWSGREKNIGRVIGTLAGMYGDLGGLCGTSLPEIKILGLEQLV